MTNLIVNGVSEKEMKTILETGHGLCNGVKGNYRDMARKVFAVAFGTKVNNPTKNHVLQALKAAKRCELSVDGTPVAKESIKISTHDAIKSGKMVADTAVWDDASFTLKLEASTI